MRSAAQGSAPILKAYLETIRPVKLRLQPSNPMCGRSWDRSPHSLPYHGAGSRQRGGVRFRWPLKSV